MTVSSRPSIPEVRPYAVVLRSPSPSQRCDRCGGHVNVLVREWGQTDLTLMFCVTCAVKRPPL